MIDNYDYFKKYDRDRAEYESRLPRCVCCGEPIWDKMWPLDGMYCETCVDTYLKGIEIDVNKWMEKQEER